MATRFIRLTLSTPGGSLDITPYCSGENAIEVTSKIEGAGTTNQFLASDVEISGTDAAPQSVITLLRTIGPTSTAHRLTIEVDTPGTIAFQGALLPATVQYDERERSFAFVATSDASRLARTKADGVLLRNVTGWYVSAPSYDVSQVVVSKAGATECDFSAGDRIGLTTAGKTEEATISRIGPGPGPSANEWTLYFRPFLNQIYQVDTVVSLLTPHQRNVPLRTAVDALFVAAGLPATSGVAYNVVPIGDPSQTFATPPNYNGLIGAPRSVVAALNGTSPALYQTQPVVGTGQKLYYQPTPPGAPWTLLFTDPDQVFQPVDWISQGSGTYLYHGPRRTIRSTAGTSVTARYYCYDWTQFYFNPPMTRYVLVVTTNIETNDWTIDIRKQVAQGTTLYLWGAETVIWSGTSGTSSDDVVLFLEQLGIEFAKVDGTIYFTEIYTKTNGHLGFRLSRINPVSLVLNTNICANANEDSRGVLFCYDPNFLGMFALWTTEGNVPRIRIFQLGVDFLELPAEPVPSDFRPFTLKPNRGKSPYAFNALSSSYERGTYLLTFDIGAVTPAVQIGAPGLGTAPGGLYDQSAYDLTVVKDLTRPVSGGVPWPMMALFGNQLWWVDFTQPDNLAYCDFDGLSCGDALAQLATTAVATFHVDPANATYFKTRSLNSTRGIGSGDAIDDARCLSLRTAPVWSKAVLYVKVIAERDDTTYGEAGDAAYAGTPLGLEIRTRFVTTSSHARSLALKTYGFFAGGAAVTSWEHEDDGRDYGLENTFLATIGGVAKRFQIVETGRNLILKTVKGVGVQLP